MDRPTGLKRLLLWYALTHRKKARKEQQPADDKKPAAAERGSNDNK